MYIDLEYLNHLADFRAPQLVKFIGRSVGPELSPFRRADVEINTRLVTFTLYRHANYPSWDRLSAQTTIRFKGINWGFSWNFSYLAQMFSQFSATLSNAVHLKLWVDPIVYSQLGGTDNSEWLQLLHRFSAVQTLFVSQTVAWDLALVLEDITAVTEVLPSLNLLCLEGEPASSVGRFVAARRLADRPVTVIDMETEYERVTLRQ